MVLQPIIQASDSKIDQKLTTSSTQPVQFKSGKNLSQKLSKPNKFLVIGLAIFFIGISLGIFKTLYVNSKTSSQPAEIFVLGASTLKYFGYYHVACSTSTSKNDIPELGRLNNSNVMMLFSVNRFCIEEARKANIKVIAWIDPFVYNRVNPRYPQRGVTTLKPDWETRWLQFKKIIRGYEDVIYAFYFEEPWWLGLNQGDFHIVSQRMMTDYPNIGRMAIESGISMQNSKESIPKLAPYNTQYYKYLTDVGVDWYGTDFTIFRDWNVGLYMPYLNSLLKLTTPSQRIWLVPQTFSKLDSPNFSRLSEILNQYYGIAQGNSRIVGILNFLYSPAAVAELGHAAKEFFDPASSVYSESYTNLNRLMGQQITGKGGSYVPTPTPKAGINTPIPTPRLYTPAPTMGLDIIRITTPTPISRSTSVPIPKSSPIINTLLSFTQGTIEREIKTVWTNSWYFGTSQFIKIPAGVSGTIGSVDFQIHHYGDNTMYALITTKTDGNVSGAPQQYAPQIAVSGDKTGWITFYFNYPVTSGQEIYLWLRKGSANQAMWLTEDRGLDTIKNYRINFK